MASTAGFGDAPFVSAWLMDTRGQGAWPLLYDNVNWASNADQARKRALSGWFFDAGGVPPIVVLGSAGRAMRPLIVR